MTCVEVVKRDHCRGSCVPTTTALSTSQLSPHHPSSVLIPPSRPLKHLLSRQNFTNPDFAYDTPLCPWYGLIPRSRVKVSSSYIHRMSWLVMSVCVTRSHSRTLSTTHHSLVNRHNSSADGASPIANLRRLPSPRRPNFLSQMAVALPISNRCPIAASVLDMTVSVACIFAPLPTLDGEESYQSLGTIVSMAA